MGKKMIEGGTERGREERREGTEEGEREKEEGRGRELERGERG